MASELTHKFDAGAYNMLTSIEEADEAVRTDSHLDRFLDEAGRLMLSHHMQGRFGVALLHKHGRCMENEHMIEYPESAGGRQALVTRPRLEDPGRSGAVPIVWQIRDQTFVPLEFSTDPLARALLLEGEAPERFLEDFRALTLRSEIGHLMGLAVVDRALYASAGPQEAAVEYSDSSERTNTVMLVSREGLEGNTIETAWSFKSVPDTIPQPVLDCLRSCRKQCWSKEGGHDKQHTPHHH